MVYAHKSIAKLNKPPYPIPKPHTIPENGKPSVLTNKHEPQQSTTHNHDNVSHTDSNNESTLDQHHGKLPLDLPTIHREQHADLYYKHLIAYLELQTEPSERNVFWKVIHDKDVHILKDKILYYLHRPKVHMNYQKDWELHIVTHS